MLRIARTNRADEDLIAIWLEIAVHDPSTADRVLDAIERRWRQIAIYPCSGIARDDIAPGIRHLIVGQYLTLYRVSDEAVEIIRVLHGRRRIAKDSVT